MYVGDVGVKSGRITMNFPIPEDIKEFQGTAENAYTDAGWNETYTQIDYSGAPTGYKGGRVVEEPKVVEVGSGQYALQGVFEGLYTGTEVTVSIKTTVQAKDDSDYNADGYAFWDGTAYVTDRAGSDASRTVRLWNQKDAGGNPTEPDPSYQLSYQFTGDVPSDAELPNIVVADADAPVKAAAAPTSALDGYTFNGWYQPDGSKVEPNSTFNMPASNLILTGKWTLDEAYVQKITVNYVYTDNNDGEHIPNGAPTLPALQTVKVGQTHYIQKIDQDASYHKFGGWVPTLSVGGAEVTLTKQSDGTYQSNDGTYIIDIAGGTLSTDQFRDKTNVIVTFGGAWMPYKGTIHFDANGGTGTMDDMTGVTWDTNKTLTANEFTYPASGYQFVGWAKTPSGAVAKGDQARADQLIDQDGETVNLYAIWKRSAYGVGYNLSHVTSSSTDTTVTLGGSYSTTLTADSGYEMSEVVVTMGGVAITNQVYNKETGVVTINNINGNILIKATATQKVTPPPTKHTITISVTNGTASPSGSVQVEDGQSQTITFTPNTGYVLDYVMVDGNSASLTGNSYIFTDVTADHSISVVYKVPPLPTKHTITISVTNGTASPSGSVQVEDGHDQTITFAPNAGYVLDHVTVDGTSASLTGNSYTFTDVTADHSISVVYKKSGGGGGSVTDKYPIYVESTGSGTAESNKNKAAAGEIIFITTEGTVESITATDKNGNEIKLTDKGNGQYTFTMPSSEVTVRVEFELNVADPDDTGVSGWLNTSSHTAFLSGYPGNIFGPNNNMTRAEAAQMFYSLLLDKDVPITASFTDVPADAWYAQAVNVLASLGIVTGIGDGKFEPQRSITRAEFTVIAMNFTNGAVSGKNIFSDVSAGDWFYNQVVGSIQYGWISGYEDGTFRPNNTITRAEVTTIVNRMLGRSADKHYVDNNLDALVQFEDVSRNHWAYYQITEATNSHDYTTVNGDETWQTLN